MTRASPSRATEARAVAAGFVLLSLAIVRDARAAGPLGDQGSRIQTSAYTIDLFQGPVFATTRITGLAGAYTAIAEGAEGIPFNPAAASLRAPSSTTMDDFDLAGGITFPASVTHNDFDNNGDTSYATKRFVWATLGGLVQHGSLGIGGMASFQSYSLGAPSQPTPLPGSNEVLRDLIIRVLRIDFVASYGLLGEQLHVGGGVRTASFFAVGGTRQTSTDVADVTNERVLLTTNSIGVQGGILWTPRALPIRVGGAARSPLVGGVDDSASRVDKNAEGDRVIANVYLPEKVDLPWEIEAGAAVQLWKRPLNIAWMDEDRVPAADAERWRRTNDDGKTEPVYKGARRMLRARYREIPREKVLLAASVLVSGPVRDAVGLESALSQTVDRSGRSIVASVRAGVEAEVIPWWLVLRGGSYLEPTRFAQSSPRTHATAGFQVGLVRWSVFGLFDEGTVWRFSANGDVARDYLSTGFGIGTVQ